jgi:putative addiction module component (TIGR02574 family)
VTRSKRRARPRTTHHDEPVLDEEDLEWCGDELIYVIDRTETGFAYGPTVAEMWSAARPAQVPQHRHSRAPLCIKRGARFRGDPLGAEAVDTSTSPRTSMSATLVSMSIRRELRRELLTLSPEERQELADELYESVVDESLDPEWERAWSEEIKKRMEDVAADRVELIDADDVHAQLRDELRDARR